MTHPHTRRYYGIIGSIGILAAVVGFLALHRLQQAENAAPSQVVTVMMRHFTFVLEVADTPALREKGLMGRTELCPSCGMLFAFDTPGRYAFWMKDTPLPLDILWVRDGKIVHIVQHTTPYSETAIAPPVDADTIIEVKAGISSSIGLVVGDVVLIRASTARSAGGVQ